MRYTVFNIKFQYCYVFVPETSISDAMLEQLKEVHRLACSSKRLTYVFVGSTDCIVISDHKVDEYNIPFASDLPDTHSLVSFPKEDASKSIVEYKKTTKAQKVKLLSSLSKITKEVKITPLITR